MHTHSPMAEHGSSVAPCCEQWGSSLCTLWASNPTGGECLEGFVPRWVVRGGPAVTPNAPRARHLPYLAPCTRLSFTAEGVWHRCLGDFCALSAAIAAPKSQLSGVKRPPMGHRGSLRPKTFHWHVA